MYLLKRLNRIEFIIDMNLIDPNYVCCFNFTAISLKVEFLKKFMQFSNMRHIRHPSLNELSLNETSVIRTAQKKKKKNSKFE